MSSTAGSYLYVAAALEYYLDSLWLPCLFLPFVEFGMDSSCYLWCLTVVRKHAAFGQVVTGYG
jgi:hypothetical protein